MVTISPNQERAKPRRKSLVGLAILLVLILVGGYVWWRSVKIRREPELFVLKDDGKLYGLFKKNAMGWEVMELFQLSGNEKAKFYSGTISKFPGQLLFIGSSEADMPGQQYPPCTIEFFIWNPTRISLSSIGKVTGTDSGEGLCSFSLVSYSSIANAAVVNQWEIAGGGKALPHIANLKEMKLLEIGELYPVIGKEIPKWGTSCASYSPDGSLLAMAILGREYPLGEKKATVLIYNLESGVLNKILTDFDYIWSITFSQDNSEIAWLGWNETDESRKSKEEWLKDPLGDDFIMSEDADFLLGIRSLKPHGKEEIYHLKQIKQTSIESFTGQDTARIAFSADGKQIYFTSLVDNDNNLLCCDRGTRTIYEVTRDVQGFCVASKFQR